MRLVAAGNLKENEKPEMAGSEGETESNGFAGVVESKPWVPVVMGIGGAVLLLILVWLFCKCRRKSRYDYSAIKEERSLLEKWQEEKEAKITAERDAMLLNCYFYFKDSDKFSVINNLPEIGSRVNKYWFSVQESRSQTDALLSILPWSKTCVLPFTKATKTSLSELFSALQHPFLLPVLYVDIVREHQLVAIVQPFKPVGSLKDIIYGARPKLTFEEKYHFKGRGLSLNHIRNYGRQVLEALLFLKEKGLPPCGNVHAGNVFVVNGVCKLSGYESTLLGFTSRFYSVIKKLVEAKTDIDIILFGHLLFEMCAGYELKEAAPGEGALASCRLPQVVDVLKFIFPEGTERQRPTLEELAGHSFFENADVRGLQSFNPQQVRYSSGVKSLLKLFRKDGAQPVKTRRKSTRKKSKAADSGHVEPSKERKQSTRSKPKQSTTNEGELLVVEFRQSASRASSTAPPVPVPPPPPPSAPQLPSEKASIRPPKSSGRGALLSDIRKGIKLKKNTAVNDRSKPRI